MNAFAIAELDDKLLVLCPHCHSIHLYDSKTTPRLIEIDAMCDKEKKIKVGEKMKESKIFYALSLYTYEKERRRNKYHSKKKKEESKE